MVVSLSVMFATVVWDFLKISVVNVVICRFTACLLMIFRVITLRKKSSVDLGLSRGANENGNLHSDLKGKWWQTVIIVRIYF